VVSADSSESKMFGNNEVLNVPLEETFARYPNEPPFKENLIEELKQSIARTIHGQWVIKLNEETKVLTDKKMREMFQGMNLITFRDIVNKTTTFADFVNKEKDKWPIVKM
jgi:hypothetical protein